MIFKRLARSQNHRSCVDECDGVDHLFFCEIEDGTIFKCIGTEFHTQHWTGNIGVYGPFPIES